MTLYDALLAASFVGLVAGLAFATAGAAGAEFVFPEQWLEVRAMGQTIGFTHITWAPGPEDPSSTLEMTLSADLRHQELGIPTGMKIRVRQIIRASDGALIRLNSALASGSLSSEMDAEVRDSGLTITSRAGESEETRTIQIPTDLPLIAEFAFLRGPLSSGQQYFHYLNPVTQTIQPGTLSVSQEGGRWVVDATGTLGQHRLRLSSDNKISHGTGPFGIELTAADASAAAEFWDSESVPAIDLPISEGIPTNILLDAPRAVRRLIVRIRGLSAAALPSIPGRQQVVREETDGVVLEIAGGEPPTGEFTVGSSPSEEAERCLGPTAYLDTENPGIQSAARRAVGGETDTGAAAKSLALWVRGHMVYAGGVQTPRRAGEILVSRSGLCRDNATLFAAMARSLGIPARLCAGLVYVDGRFYLHAWDEIWMERWVAVDPTIPGDFVDATHITVSIGDVPQIWDIAPYGPTLVVEVLENE